MTDDDDRDFQALAARVLRNAARLQSAKPAEADSVAPVPRVGEGAPVTKAQVQAAMARWEVFFGTPKHLAGGVDSDAWLAMYVEAVNGLPLVRKYWSRVSSEILGASRWFPYPSDLQTLAERICERSSAW